jgi:hypothetical protein
MADQSAKNPFDMGALDMGGLASMGAAYQRKLLEFGQENAKAAFDFATSLATCRSPTDFMNLTQDYARQQVEAVQRQTRELMEIAQNPAGTSTTHATPV